MTTLPPDVADLLRAVKDALPPGGTVDYREAAAVVNGVLDAVLGGCGPVHGAAVLRDYRADPAAYWRWEPPSTVCDTCHSEPVSVIDGDRPAVFRWLVEAGVLVLPEGGRCEYCNTAMVPKR